MHISFSDIVGEIADQDWGREFDSKSDAAKAILGDKEALNAFATLELIKRFNAIGRAAGKSRCNCHEARRIELIGIEKKFPNKSVGDRLYLGDLDGGIDEFVIVAKDSEDRCMIVMLNDFDLDYPPKPRVATEDYKETLEDAVKEAAEIDFRYHTIRAEHAKAGLDAVKYGDDLSPFTVAFEDPEEEELESV